MSKLKELLEQTRNNLTTPVNLDNPIGRKEGGAVNEALSLSLKRPKGNHAYDTMPDKAANNSAIVRGLYV